MTVAVVTGSAGLVGSESSLHFAELGLDVVGIDNDMRGQLLGSEASTGWQRRRLERILGRRYTHLDLDVRDRPGIDRTFTHYGAAIELVIHSAAQPSHDWAATSPLVDFDLNAVATLNLLEATRVHAPQATFLFCSTNKVYGDTPNRLPLHEMDTRYEIDDAHPFAEGIRENMSTDQSLHSLFGVSKLAADMLVQEYGRYFGLRTACFRAGTLTGPQHAATRLHGFLGYVMRCAMTGTPYVVQGYKGKQVRDVLHARDVVRAFSAFFHAPRIAEVYNLGGGRTSNVSVLEAIELAEEVACRRVVRSYQGQARIGDHIWWISDNARFKSHFPKWSVDTGVTDMLREMFEENHERWSTPSAAIPASER